MSDEDNILFASESLIAGESYAQVTQYLADLPDGPRADCIKICENCFEVIEGGDSYLDIASFFNPSSHARRPDREYFFRTIRKDSDVIGFALFSFILSQVVGKLRLEVDMQLVAFDRDHQKKALVWLYALAIIFNLEQATPIDVDIFCIVNDRSYRLFRHWSHTTGAESHSLQSYLSYLFSQVFVAHHRPLRSEASGRLRLAEPVLKLPNVDVNAECDLVLVADGANTLNRDAFEDSLRKHGLWEAYQASSTAAVSAWRLIYANLALKSIPQAHVEAIIHSCLAGHGVPHDLDPPIHVYFPHFTVKQLLELEATGDVRVRPGTDAWRGRIPNTEHFHANYPFKEALLSILNLPCLGDRSVAVKNGHLSLKDALALKGWMKTTTVATWEDYLAFNLLLDKKTPAHAVLNFLFHLKFSNIRIKNQKKFEAVPIKFQTFFLSECKKKYPSLPKDKLTKSKLTYATATFILYINWLSKILSDQWFSGEISRYLIANLSNGFEKFPIAIEQSNLKCLTSQVGFWSFVDVCQLARLALVEKKTVRSIRVEKGFTTSPIF